MNKLNWVTIAERIIAGVVSGILAGTIVTLIFLFMGRLHLGG